MNTLNSKTEISNFRLHWLAALASGYCLFLASAKADTDALTVSGGTGGYVIGGAGFYFVPSVDLTVTRVGYLDFPTGHEDPIVSIWSGTDHVIASYNLAPGTDSGLMIYTSASLSLTAGQPYSITLQEGPLSAGNLVTVQAGGPAVGIGQFQVAPELTAYTSEVVSSTGAFTPQTPNAYILGPNFSYQVVPEPGSLSILLLCGCALLFKRFSKGA
jgi:hypothetical protein